MLMYRKTFLLSFCSLVSVSLYVNAQNYITLYEDCNYGGRSHTLAPGSYTVNQMKIANDRLSSMKIPGDLKVTIYEHSDFRGKSKVYNGNIQCLESAWNDVASSIVVENKYSQPGTGSGEYITFYNDCYSRGYSRSLKPGTYNGSQLGLLRYNISSFTIHGDLQIKAYLNNISLSGYPVVYNESINCLSSGEDNKIGSLVIERRSYTPPAGGGYEDYVMMFADCNYEGNGLMLQPGYYRGDQLGLMRYNIASIQVPQGLQVKAYINNDNLSGQSYTISDNISCMNNNLRNRIGSLVIERTGWENNNNNNNTGAVVIFEHEDYKGRSATLQPGNYSTMYQAGFVDNALSSLIVPDGYKVILYEHENFSGDSYTIYRTKSKFYFSGWSDRASSIRVIKD